MIVLHKVVSGGITLHGISFQVVEAMIIVEFLLFLKKKRNFRQ